MATLQTFEPATFYQGSSTLTDFLSEAYSRSDRGSGFWHL
jgi:hypothetical protein